MDIARASAPTYNLSWTDNAKETLESLRGHKPQGTPLRLYDIERHRVVRRSNVCYAILSYVWKQWSRDNLQNIVEHMVRECGLRYVWVDAWCINQADPEEKVREIGKMCTYYREAAVGLVLIPDWTQSRGDVVAGVILGWWADRVWTLQEGSLLSKALIVGFSEVADHRDYTSKLCSNTAMHVPLAGSKVTDGMLYESFEEAWNDTTRYCSVKEDLIWGYTAVVRGAHKIAGKYGRDWPSLLQEAAEAGCITAGLLASGPPEKGPGRSWMAEVSTNPSGDYTLTASFVQQSPHFDPAEITDMGMVTQGTIVTVEVGEFNFTNNKTPIHLTSSQNGFMWTVNLGSNLHGDGWEKGAKGIIFTQRSGFGGNAAALIMVEERSPGHYRRIGWAAVETPRVELEKVDVCIG